MNLTLALVGASVTPLLLLDGDFTVVAASQSFCDVFGEGRGLVGKAVFDIGDGEWDLPRLRSLLTATASGAAVAAYELDLDAGQGIRNLVVSAHKLRYGEAQDPRMMMTVIDATDARAESQLKDNLLREKTILLQEVQHRVANSLQIISSVILQSARRTRSEETRDHLHDANHRVLSVAEVQRQLAVSSLQAVALKPYLTQLGLSLGASMISDHRLVSIDVDVDETEVEPRISVSLGLIVTELVINALKHAFPGGRAGKIFIAYSSRGPNWTLSVSDDGVGMPTDHGSRKAGLGTSIVEALANQLQADVRVTEQPPGVSVAVVHTQIAVVGRSAKTDPTKRAV